MSNLEKFLNSIIKYGFYAILLTPLAFWIPALYPFAAPKFLLFQILVEIVFAVWLITGIRSLLNRDRIPVLNWCKSYIAIALFVFLGVSFISTIFGIDFLRSFWGIGPRMTGLFAELHFLAWFLVLISYLKTKEEWNRYLNFSLGTAVIVALTAFYQNPAWGLTFGSTIFNNPTFVSPYLIFHFFWGLYQTLNYKRWFYGIGTALLLFVILLNQVRGAILGLLAGILLLLIVLILTDIFNERIRILLSACFLVILIAVSGFWYFRNANFLRVGALRKFTEISLANTTVKTRLLAWQVSLKGFWHQPVWGVGPENFNYIFNRYYDPKFLKFGGGGFGETWFDKPHNAFLEILAETGIVGSLVYVLIWTAVVMALFKLFKSGQKLLTMILSGAFTAYFGAVFFSFDSFGSWFGVFLFLAFLASQNRDTNIRIHTNDTNNTNKKNISILFVSLVIISILVSLFYFNYSIWRANIADAGALRTFSKDVERGIALFKKSLNYPTPYKAEYQFDLIASVAGALQKNVQLPNPEETINFALEAADEALVAHPKNAAYYTDMARIYMILGEKGKDPAILAQAEVYGRKSLELSPSRQETLFYLARIALLENNTGLAIEWAKQAVNAESFIGSSHWYLGLAYIAGSQKEKGIAEIKNALELGYRLQNRGEEEFIKSLGL